MVNHYDILKVQEQASFKEIKEKYIYQSKKYHPDVSPETAERYYKIQEAYQVLSNPGRRKKYDLGLGIRDSLWERELEMENFSEKF